MKVKHVSSGKTWIWKLAKKITKDPRVEKPGFVNSPPPKKTTQRCCSHKDSNVEMKHLNGILFVPLVKRQVSMCSKMNWRNLHAE